MEVIGYIVTDKELNYINNFQCCIRIKYEKMPFHAYLNPNDCIKHIHTYYDVYNWYDDCFTINYKDYKFFKVKLSGNIKKCNEKNTIIYGDNLEIIENVNIRKECKISKWWEQEAIKELLYYQEGFAIISQNDCSFNFIDKNGKLLSEKWFRLVQPFKEGCAKVMLKNYKYNFINSNGNYISKFNFDSACDFKNGFAQVQRSDMLWNYIDKEGKILSNEWFKTVGEFTNRGFAQVQRNDDVQYKIDKTGKLWK